MTDIQYNTPIVGGPTGFGFSPKASGFYPFGDATDLDRCEALASAKGCFLCFCFWFHPRFRQQCRIYPQECSTEPQKCTNLLGWGNKKKKIGGWFRFFVVETKGFEPLTSAMWLQRSKPAGLRLYFRLAMQSNKKFGDLATYWRFFLSWSGIFSGFS